MRACFILSLRTRGVCFALIRGISMVQYRPGLSTALKVVEDPGLSLTSALSPGLRVWVEAPADVDHGDYGDHTPWCLRERKTGFFTPNTVTAPCSASSDVS